MKYAHLTERENEKMEAIANFAQSLLTLYDVHPYKDARFWYDTIYVPEHTSDMISGITTYCQRMQTAGMNCILWIPTFSKQNSDGTATYSFLLISNKADETGSESQFYGARWVLAKSKDSTPIADSPIPYPPENIKCGMTYKTIDYAEFVVLTPEE